VEASSFDQALDRIMPREERERRLKDRLPLGRLVRLLNAIAQSASASVPLRVN
jgi:hypothetical protein